MVQPLIRLRDKGGESEIKAVRPQSDWGTPDARSFDPRAMELRNSWQQYAKMVLCLNAYPNGITLSLHNLGELSEPGRDKSSQTEGEPGADKSENPRESAAGFNLRFRDTRDYQLPAGRYFLYKENYAEALESHLSQLKRAGDLESTVIYFGLASDPFLALHKKFDVTTKCVALLEKYRPAKVVFQTRSPLVISILPTLKNLGERAAVSLAVETISERAVQRYMPGMPRIGERLITADGLRKQGIKVHLQVSPILPYGDPKRDVWDFAEVLDRHADYVTFSCLASGKESDERALKNLPIAQKLTADGQHFYLRPHCYQYVYLALKALHPEKLLLPVKRPVKASQLSLFAA